MPIARSDMFSLSALSGFGLLLLLAQYVLFVVPDAAFVEWFLNDVFGLADAAYRTSEGQIPSIDFISLYGASTYYPTAAGFKLGFTTGGSLAFGHFLTACLLVTCAVLTLYRRFSLIPAALLLLFVFLLVAVPLRPGGGYANLTYGIFYTRHGWAGLTIALLFYVDPRHDRRFDLWIDSVVLALLVLFLVFLKITFGAVAVAFVIANAITSRYKLRLSMVTLALVVAVMAVLEAASSYPSAYLSPIASFVLKTAVPIRRGTDGVMTLIQRHAVVFAICYSALIVLATAGRIRFFDFAFVTGAIVSCIMIMDQSGGTHTGLPPLAVIPLLVGEFLRRQEGPIGSVSGAPPFALRLRAIAVFAMFVVLIAQPTVTTMHAWAAHTIRLNRAVSAGETSLDGIYAGRARSGPTTKLHMALGHDDASHDELHAQRTRPLRAREYAPLVEEGIALLETVPLDGKSVVTIAQTNPFSVMMRLRPTRRGRPLHFVSSRRTAAAAEQGLLQKVYPPELFISDADYVMVPEVPYDYGQYDLLMQIYGDTLTSGYEEIGRSDHWRLYGLRED